MFYSNALDVVVDDVRFVILLPLISEFCSWCNIVLNPNYRSVLLTVRLVQFMYDKTLPPNSEQNFLHFVVIYLHLELLHKLIVEVQCLY